MTKVKKQGIRIDLKCLEQRWMTKLSLEISKMEKKQKNLGLVVWQFRFYGVSTFVGYLKPNQLLYK